MKKFAFLILFLVGATQIVVGLIFGPLRVASIEALFWRDLGLSEQHSRAFSHYIGLLKEQWHVVAVLGLIIVVATGTLLLTFYRKV